MKTLEAQSLIHIGQVVRNALAFGSSRGATLSDISILDKVERLFALLGERKTGYLLVGGIALLQYVECRNFEDIELILSPSSLARLPEIEVPTSRPCGRSWPKSRRGSPGSASGSSSSSAPRPWSRRMTPGSTAKGLSGFLFCDNFFL
jgi:hypothetical protein